MEEGVIVDEEGLDVIYWRILENGYAARESLEARAFSNGSDDRQQGQASSPAWPNAQNQPLTWPPPPPELAEKKSLPPPQPPNPGGLVESLTSQNPGNGKHVSLEPLRCGKAVANANHSMTRNKTDDGSFSFNFDGDLMEALFGYVATNRKSPKGERKTGPIPQIFILETQKSQDIAIVLKSLRITRREIIDALNEGEGLNAETLEKLCRVAPTREEESEILGFAGDPTRLADAESFLFHILKSIPSAFSRFNAMLFRSNYTPEIGQLNESLLTLEQACNELRGQRLLMKLADAVLKAGNRMNEGTSRGDAQAFGLTALTKLSDVKSIDGKTTLLHFVVHEVVRAEGKRCVSNRDLNLSKNDSQTSSTACSHYDKEKDYIMLGLPVVGGLSSEFTNAKKAAMIDCDALSTTCSILSSQASEIRKFVAQCTAAGGGRFATKMKVFLDIAEREIKAAKVEHTRVMELVKRTADYYQAGASNSRSWQPLQLFVITMDFLGLVDRVCVEIASNLQNKKLEGPTAGSSSLTEEPQRRAVRFPKIPANFLSQQGKSNPSGFSNYT
ncbi:unnamed protein product [Cuscuta campestris]|uniref:Formin-like protein n=1 Tax=Cuscuta campestris TaxID=132261 RepID=A0A484KQG3_9ASTE|nr:unnamed protein product [Cuscuta campestris]